MARSQIDFVDDCPILDEVVHWGHTVQSAEAALLVAALFDLGVGDRPVIDPDRASLYLSRYPERPVDVRGPDRRGEAVLRVVRRHEPRRRDIADAPMLFTFHFVVQGPGRILSHASATVVSVHPGWLWRRPPGEGQRLPSRQGQPRFGCPTTLDF
jgi:hypothetical protein